MSKINITQNEHTKLWREMVYKRNLLSMEAAKLEFKIKGYLQALSSRGIKIYHFIKRTPLHKDKYCIGVKAKEYYNILYEELPLIIAITNTKRVNENIFYVFDPKLHIGFRSGLDSQYEYIRFCMVEDGKKHYLPTIQEYLEQLDSYSNKKCEVGCNV